MQLPFAAESRRFFVYLLFIASTISTAGIEIATGMLYVLFFAESLLQKNIQWLWHSNKNWKMVCAWLGIIAITEGFNGYPLQLREVLGDYWRLGLPFMLVLSLKHVDLKKLLPVFFACLVFISFYGIVQHFTGADWFRSEGRPTSYKHPCYSIYGHTEVFHAKGNFTHHLTFGGMLLLSFPTFLSLSLSQAVSIRLRWIYRLGCVVIFGAVLLSLARSIWIGSLLACLVLGFRLPKKVIATAFVGVLLGIGALVGHYSLQDHTLDQPVSGIGLIWQRLESGLVLKYNQDRLLMWQSAKNAIQDHWMLGFGVKNDSTVMPPYRQAAVEASGHAFFNSAGAGVHNLYLQLLLNNGLLGLLAYLFAAIFVFWQFIGYLRRHSNPLGLEASIVWGVLASCSGFMVASVFENNFFDAEVQAMGMTMLGLAFYAMSQDS